MLKILGIWKLPGGHLLSKKVPNEGQAPEHFSQTHPFGSSQNQPSVAWKEPGGHAIHWVLSKFA